MTNNREPRAMTDLEKLRHNMLAAERAYAHAESEMIKARRQYHARVACMRSGGTSVEVIYSERWKGKDFDPDK